MPTPLAMALASTDPRSSAPRSGACRSTFARSHSNHSSTPSAPPKARYSISPTSYRGSRNMAPIPWTAHRSRARI
ncbi:hypothetical protein BC567DRAFT_221978 [Phyllosticta citribraziliensis]